MGRTFADRSSNVDFAQMMRFLRNLLFHLFGYFIAAFLFLPYAFAVTQPAQVRFAYGFLSGHSFTAAGAECARAVAARNVIHTPAATYTHFTYTPLSGMCFGTINGTPNQSIANFVGSYYCPDASWTLSGSTCTKPDPCASSGTVHSSGYFHIGTDPTARFITYACGSGCELIFSGTSPAASSLVGAVRTYFALGSYVHTGTSCTSGTAPASSLGAARPSDTCGANQVRGTINNQVVCIDKTTGDQVSESPKSTTTTSDVVNPDSSTTRTTTTIDENGRKSTTTATFAPGADPDTDSPLSSETERPSAVPDETNPNEQFCASNPDAPMCTHFCSLPENASKVQCLDLGESGAEQGLDTKTFGVTSITPVTFASATGCPAPIPLPNNTEFSFQWSCDFLEALKPMLLALAWLSAGLITVGAFRES